MASNQDRIRLVLEAAEIAIRTPILFLLDFTLNGALIALAVNYFTLLSRDGEITEKPNIYDVLFALERQNVSDIWSELSWTSYSVWSFVYFLVLLVGISLFFIDSSVLLTITDHLCPFILLIASITFSLEDNPRRHSAVPDPGADDSAPLKQLLTASYRVIIRTLYGYSVGQFYYYRRRPVYESLSVFGISHSGIQISTWTSRMLKFLLVQAPFYIPLLNSLSQIVELPAAVVWALFTPILVVELCYSLFLAKQYLLPYILVVPIVLSRMIAQPDLIRLQLFFNVLWIRLRIPQVFRTFFGARFALQFIYVIYVALVLGPDNDPYSVFAKRRLTADWLWTGGRDENGGSSSEPDHDAISMIVSAVEYLLARSCETLPAVMATTSIVSLFGRWSGFVFHWILTGERRRNRTAWNQQGQAPAANNDADHAEENLADGEENDESTGQLTGALFLILCLQTGLTSLPAEKRLWKLYRNLWLLTMAVLHFVHHMVQATMNQLCTHGRFRWTKHVRAMALGIFLFFAPFLFFKLSWRHNNWLNPWLISVAIFAVELTAKMLISFVVYALMLFDVWHPRVSTEELLYLVKTAGAILDLLFGFCLLLNGVWILLYEHGGMLRTFMICIHGYFNIYQRAKKGWAQLKRRRLATRKLNTLQNATRKQLLEARDEVCAICYVEFHENGNEDQSTVGIAGWVQSEVKVTACGHMLHSACLLKWLYIRDSCPLCHRTVFDDESLRCDDAANDAGRDMDDGLN